MEYQKNVGGSYTTKHLLLSLLLPLLLLLLLHLELVDLPGVVGRVALLGPVHQDQFRMLLFICNKTVLLLLLHWF